MAEFLEMLGVSQTLPENWNAGESYSDLIAEILKVDRIARGHVTCSFAVKPCICNPYNGLHGGMVAAIAERVAIACARLFLGELSTSYLSAARINTELIVEGSVMRSGRNLSVV